MDGAIIYRGSANIEIEILYFRSDKSGDPAHESNVERLATTFRNKGCQTTKLQNHIPVRIDQRLLNRALQNSRIPAERLVADTLGNYPKLEFPSGSRLECLHGQARVRAAIEVLPLGERRWTVDFYIVGPGLVATLVEEYANNEWHPGEIYHRMRRCHRQKNQGIDNLWFEKRWRAHLSCHEQRNVVALSHYDDIMSTCDDLLDAPGLRKDWRLTTWHKILSMRIEEYILNYLTSMKNFWYGIVQGDSEALQKVDEATVKALELMAPGACRADARTLRCQLDSGQIFGAFNGREREEIWVRVLDFTSDRLVPTFSSFFEDLNWFEHPIDCVKRLIHLGRRETIVSALGRMFSDLNQQAGYCVIQRSEHTFVSAPGNRANRLDWGIRQIFISAMRNYPDMAPRPKKRDLLAKPKTKEADTTGLFEFAVLAHRLGFESPEIHELMDSPPPLSASKEHVTFVDDANPDTKVKRCGIPYGKHHQKDRPLLFLENLHDASIQELGEMSSWFVRRSSYLAFFGKLARTLPLGVVTGTANSEQARETVQKEDRRQAALSEREGLEQHRTVRKTGKSRPSAPSKSYSSSLAQNFRYLELNLIRKCMRRLKRIESLVRRCSKKWNKRTPCRARKRGMPKSNTVA